MTLGTKFPEPGEVVRSLILNDASLSDAGIRVVGRGIDEALRNDINQHHENRQAIAAQEIRAVNALQAFTAPMDVVESFSASRPTKEINHGRNTRRIEVDDTRRRIRSR